MTDKLRLRKNSVPIKPGAVRIAQAPLEVDKPPC